MKSSAVSPSRHSLSQVKYEFKNFIPKKFRDELMNSSHRIRNFDPLSTLHCFLFQCLESGSCKSALISLNVSKRKNAQKTVALNTSAYSRARKRLCEKTLSNLVKDVGEKISQKSSCWKWKGRNVKLVDGTTLTASDTKENQNEYPQSDRQKKGLGCPMMRLLGIFDHGSGAILDFELGPYFGKGTAEPSLLRKMLDRFSEGDLLILDRFFTSYFIHYDKRKRSRCNRKIEGLCWRTIFKR